MTTKKTDWASRSRESKLASVLFPLHADEATRAEMDEISAASGRKSPTQRAKLLSHSERQSCSPLGGQAKKKL
jgi:hypothetical protein